jgi:nicotinamide mononucleotide transporter
MTGLLEVLYRQVLQLSPAEAVAVLAAVAYLLLAIRQSLWCWPCACISTVLYIGLFVEARLYMESLLNFFYLGMAIYGWYHWWRGATGNRELPVTRLPGRWHACAIAALCGLAAVNGHLLGRYTDAAFPYVDSLTTWSAIWATWLVARKIFENWWYWLVIDAVSTVIYWIRDLELTAALFVVYLMLIPFGIVSWRRAMTGAAA